MSMGFRLQLHGQYCLRDTSCRQYLRVTRWLNEEQAAMDSGILNVAFPLSSKLLSKICRMLVLDVLHYRIPAKQKLAHFFRDL